MSLTFSCFIYYLFPLYIFLCYFYMSIEFTTLAISVLISKPLFFVLCVFLSILLCFFVDIALTYSNFYISF